MRAAGKQIIWAESLRNHSGFRGYQLSRIYRELTSLIDNGQNCALATLVSTSGSSPQNAGAKVIFLPDGRILGTIGGGCMEAEARRVGLDCIRTKTYKLFDLRLDDDFGWDDGLICGGQVNIFVDPSPERSREAYFAAVDAADSHRTAALCTFVRGGGDLVGMTFLADAEGKIVPGQEVDALNPWIASAIAKSVPATLEAGKERLVPFEDGSAVYIEPILPRPTVVIAGAGHVGAALGQIMALCGFEVVIVDDRPSFANMNRLPFADRAIVEDIPGFLRSFPISDQTYFVIVTRGHRHDAHCLREVVKSKAKYIGMIGSKRKICVIYEELLKDGMATAEELKRVHSPLGFDIGSREVGEIAVSIAAELVAVRRGVDPSTVKSLKYTPPFV
jgi:xanthine dehydrogenase accessory factor